MLQDLLTALRSTSLKPYLDRLQSLVSADPELRAVVRDLGKALTGLAEEPAAPATESASTATTSIASASPSPSPAATERTAASAPVAPHLHVRSSAPSPSVVRRLEAPDTNVVWPPPPRSFSGVANDFSTQPRAGETSFEPASEEDLPQIAVRTRLKAQATRWAAERQEQLQRGEPYGGPLEQRRLELVAQAKAIPRCLLWMCRPEFRIDDPTWYEQLNGSFDAVADVTEILTEMTAEEERSEVLPDALKLAAEAQSALRVAVEAANPNRADWDQLRIYHWLRTAASEKNVWIDRYMRVDDPANPADWHDLRQRIAGVREVFDRVKGKDKRRRRGLNKIRYLLRQLQENPGLDRLEQWKGVVETATELVQSGLPPSNAELRESLLSSLDDLPDEIEASKEFALVLREIERYLDSRHEEQEVNGNGATARSEEVKQAAELLRGKAAIFIGGVKRPDAARAIADALELKELIWIEGKDQSYFDFEPDVARPDVAVVLLAIRWSRHGFGGVKTFCDRYGKPLVHLPTGYNPNQVAHQIVEQVGGRL